MSDEPVGTFADAPDRSILIPHIGKNVNVPVDLLRHAEYNPRRIVDESKFEALKESLIRNNDFFMEKPLWVNMAEGREGIVFVGNQRLDAAIALGMDKVPCKIFSIDEAKEKAWNLMDNDHAAEFDDRLRGELIIDLRDQGYDMESLALSPENVIDLTDLAGQPPVESGTGEEEGNSAQAPGKKKEVECPECHHIFTP